MRRGLPYTKFVVGSELSVRLMFCYAQHWVGLNWVSFWLMVFLIRACNVNWLCTDCKFLIFRGAEHPQILAWLYLEVWVLNVSENQVPKLLCIYWSSAKTKLFQAGHRSCCRFVKCWPNLWLCNKWFLIDLVAETKCFLFFINILISVKTFQAVLLSNKGYIFI